MIAVVPVREGTLPGGADEAVAEAGGRAVLVGDGTAAAAAELRAARAVVAWEAGAYRAGAWAQALADRLRDEAQIVLPGSPDGRDLAPRLARALGRPLLAGAIAVRADGATLVRHGGLLTEEARADGPFVATLQPGVRGVGREEFVAAPPSVEPAALELPDVHDAEVLELLPPDPATIDLAEAPRVIAGGQGLRDLETFEQLAAVAQAIGASVGATRVATDAGWAPFERQIGTTGVAIDPDLYIALGISGAVQHTAGLGQPDHIVSVNLDASCPMMEMADLALVTDAGALVRALRAVLTEEPARA